MGEDNTDKSTIYYGVSTLLNECKLLKSTLISMYAFNPKCWNRKLCLNRLDAHHTLFNLRYANENPFYLDYLSHSDSFTR